MLRNGGVVARSIFTNSLEERSTFRARQARLDLVRAIRPLQNILEGHVEVIGRRQLEGVAHQVVVALGVLRPKRLRYPEVDEGQPLLQPPTISIPDLPEPEPMVAEKHHDGVLRNFALHQVRQKVLENVVHPGRCVDVVVAEGVHPEEAEFEFV